MSQRAAIILAAGQGTRMKSALPKVLHKVGGRAMLDWSIDLAGRVGCTKIVIVISPDADVLRDHVTATLGADAIAVQEKPLGTGNAVQAAEDALAGFKGDVVVLYGDTPLISAPVIEDMFQALEDGAAIGILGFESEKQAYGRLVMNADGYLDAIVEAREATPAQLKIRLCNAGVMACRAGRLFRLLNAVTDDNAKGEFYLTDLPALAREDGDMTRPVICPEADVMGVDVRSDLAIAEGIFQTRRRGEALAGGVTMIAPETIWFSHDTIIEADVTLEPNIVFGPGVHVCSGAVIKAFSHLEGAHVGRDCMVGPHARLRPGAVLERGAKVGNFVEVKNTHIGAGAKASHLSYLGDGDIGAGANIGAGTIFCNYDGFFKHRTVIGEGAFVGSNSALVAPVKIGEGAYIGSGSVVTSDVSRNALAVGRARQKEFTGWAANFRTKMRAKKEGGGKADE